uniref:SRCR domain-containing protein n=1 Tax=Strix occidentalis caurina TaxID=311401 RepID=A0A8D0EMU9_STROC
MTAGLELGTPSLTQAIPTVLGLGVLLTHPMLVFKGAAEVRLADGGRRCAGRVEMKHRGQWGTVCGLFWDIRGAAVVCKQLGCGSAVGASQYGHFGQGSGPVWVHVVCCKGTESALSDCTYSKWGNYRCDHRTDAGVMCSGKGTTSSIPLGLGLWKEPGCALGEQQSGTRALPSVASCTAELELGARRPGCVCDTNTPPAASSGMCSRRFGEGLLGGDVGCGHVTARGLWKLPVVFGLFCFFPGFVHLVEGKSRCSGHVQIHDGDQWKTVCASHFGPKAADVVCREFQCGAALPVPEGSHFGEGVGPIWDGELQCVGNESLLSSCPRGSSRDQPCTHASSAVVTCTRFRLVNGSTVCAGRVEVQVLGTWATLCASRWDLSDAHVLCRQLNCGFAESIPGEEHFRRETGPVWRDSFHCDGTEAHLYQCLVTTLGASPCSQGNTAAVICSGDFGSLRLVGRGSRCDGRVEIFQDGVWGRVLDDQWDVQEASVVCRQLWCGEARTAYNPPKPERGMGPVGLRGVRCAGHEANLSLCNTSLPESTLAAGVAEDVGVICEGEWHCAGPPGDGLRWLRLVNGAGCCAGRVEIYYQGIWGTVCDDGWDLADAAVVCQQLGCGGAVEAAGSARFGEGSGQIWLDGVNCSGAKAALWDCPAGPWGQHDCGYKEDAGVICSEFAALRLENSDGCSGHLQVFYNGTWGSVCSNSMTLATVTLVCKELGCGDGGSLEKPLTYSRVSGPAWLDRVNAPGLCLLSWSHGRSLPSPAREKIRTVGGEDGCSGRVEVWYRGSWGTVCDDSWDMQDAKVACRQLGCGPAVSALREAAFGMGMGPIWLEQVECQGMEPSLQDCWARPGDGGACRHKEDAAVHCSGEWQGWDLLVRYWVSVPIITCIILGALLCLLLALLAGQVLSTRAGCGGESFLRDPRGRYFLEGL